MSLADRTVDMVGRADELSRVQALFERAESAEPTAAVLAGEAGIGKSRLVREFQARAEGRADVLIGRCVDLGDAPAPYGPIVTILRELIARRGMEESMRAAGPGRAALRLLLPELSVPPQEDGGPELAPTPDRLREAVVTLLESAAETRPLVLVVEDLHWADEATLSLLTFLLRVVVQGRLFVLMTWRSEESRRGDPVRSFLAEAERARLVERIALSRLDTDAVRTLLTALTGVVPDEDRVEQLQERAEGVPFFVEELAECADGPLPETLRDLLLSRFDALGEDTASVVRLVSASESSLAHDLLAELCELPGQRLDDAIRRAIQAGVLVVDGDGYAFRHALLREAVHGDLLPGERARLHRRFAQALQERADTDPGHGRHSALAHHWYRAHDRRRALGAALAAMEQAKAGYAFPAAARFGLLAMELWDQVDDAEQVAGRLRRDFLGKLASILRNAGDSERALAIVDLALADDRGDDPRATVRLLRDKAQYLANVGRPGSAELLTEALERMDGVDDDRLRAVLFVQLASRRALAGLSAEAVAAASRARQSAENAGAEAELSLALNLRATARANLGEIDEAFADFALSRAHAVNPSAMLRYLVNLSDLVNSLGRYREAIALAEEGLAQARASGVERSSGAIMLQNAVEPLIELGEVARAESLLERDRHLRTFLVVRLYTTLSRVRVLAWRGRTAEAESLLRTWLPAFEQGGELEQQVRCYAVMMQMAVAESADDPAAALAAALSMTAQEHPYVGYERRVLLEATGFVDELRARGADVAHAVADLRAAWEAQPPRWRDGSWATIVAGLLAPDDDALARAVLASDNEDVPVVFRVRTRLAWARSCLREGERTRAAALLQEAQERVALLGHAHLASEVSAVARDAGLLGDADGGGDRGAAGPEMTARERQVLGLLAEGLSNRAIGERLYISAKTVSVHVSAILRKLGVATRTEAAVFAARDAGEEPAGTETETPHRAES